jgi:hypothetical protein
MEWVGVAEIFPCVWVDHRGRHTLLFWQLLTLSQTSVVLVCLIGKKKKKKKKHSLIKFLIDGF